MKTIKEEIVQKNEEAIEENNTTENLTTKNNLDLNNINGICNALKMLNTHQQSRIYSLYKIYIDNKKQDNKEENANNEISNEDLENVYDLNDSYTILLDYKLGSGAFGQIYKCLNKKTNKLYAAKIRKKNIMI